MRYVVLDTNALIQALPTKSPYHRIWSDFLGGKYRLCVSNEILSEYEEILSVHTSPKVFLYGSYSKGCAHDGSDIDIAVVVPLLDGDWLTATTKLWTASRKLNTLIEPVLLEERYPSPLYDDVLRTGVAV
ncbi:MAG: PIN domain-containing protein [Bacteroidales bacterium]|nr:PIN domain-containing protein [Bacteroidales bacterium]